MGSNRDTMTSLFYISARAVVTEIGHYAEMLHDAPPHIKDQCLKLMSRRGLVTDENIEMVVHKRLKTLELNLCENITDNGLYKLKKVCPYLCKIDLNCTATEIRSAITSEGITSLAQSCPHLQIVFLRKCDNITDDGVIALTTNCRHLQHLNLRGCTQLTDRSMITIADNLSFLSSLNVSMTQITDEGVYRLVSGDCKNTLKELDISSCIELTDEAVEGVTQCCKQISILIFHGCPKMTEQARIALEELAHRQGTKIKQLTFTVY
ncbi:hypothetical protein SNE40_018472 [Patella caerulea]|uniref:F-box/LRR-repeat protein 15-like leucin rich repeat domain-containing protein n=1 Tax=Patella caerulea TaxID=87958 RepID=A0AAN8P3Y1_PATCE